MTHTSICAVCSGQEAGNKWLPRSIGDYRDNILARYNGEPFDKEHKLYPVASNVAYNLQYLEYLNQCFDCLYLTSVLRAQNVKMFLLTSSQIIECFLYIRLVEMGVHKDSIWDFQNSLREATNKNLFGLGPHFYRNEMRWLKEQRNRIHIQSPVDITEADYTVFENIDVLNRTKEILEAFLQKTLKMPTTELHEIFYFLRPTNDFVHTLNSHEQS